MKKNYALISVLIFLIFSSFAKANNSIVYVDMDKVIYVSKPGASLFKQLNELNKENTLNFKKSEEKLKKLELDIISKKNILSEDEFKKKVKILKSDVKKYNENRKKIIDDFNKLKINSTNNLLKLVNPILTDYSEANSINLIMQKKNLIMGKKEFDITDEIINLVNKNIKEIDIK